ncbi:MAG: hypothetical protein H0V31_04400 [Acidobacteria bacterium]|nr:hypothetical protein [Acidobacteriota bacterium]
MDPTTVFVVAIISATVTIVSLVLSIFGSAWLNQRNNERLFESLKNEIKAEIQKLDVKIDALDVRVSRIERQLEQLFRPTMK